MHTTQTTETPGAAIEWAVATVLWLGPIQWDTVRAVVPAHEPITVGAWRRAPRADDARVAGLSPALDRPPTQRGATHRHNAAPPTDAKPDPHTGVH